MSGVLKNCLELFEKCYKSETNAVPSTNQMLRLCQDTREAVESLLMLGIGLPASEDHENDKNWKLATQEKLSDTVDLTLYSMNNAEVAF